MSGPRNWYGRCQDSGSSITTRIPLLTLLCQPLPCFSSVAALPAPGPNPWKLLTSISLILLQESYITEGIHFETGFLSCPVLIANLWTVAFQAPLSMDFSGKGTGVGCHFLLQEIFPTQGSNPGLPHCRQTLYCLSLEECPMSIVKCSMQWVCL